MIADGTALGHYAIISTLGKGGMGEVYLAEDQKLHRRVAIKLLPSVFALDPERRQRFEREAMAVAALNHPNIVTIHSIETDGPVPFLTMEYVEGESLRSAIPKDGFALDKLLSLGVGMSEAVAAAHQRGIVHRDLKPANVMIAPDGRVKVLDFGLAKLHEAETAAAGEASTKTVDDLTGEGKIVGTVAYMSPEQAEGKPVDQRSDIFSLGVVLHEMATGDRPFKGDTDISVISAIIKDTPSSVSNVRPDVPIAFARIVKRCMAKDPLRRYQSAQDLRNDLEELKEDVANGTLAMASSASGIAAASGGRRRNRTAALVGGAAVILLAAAAWGSWLLVQRARAPRVFSAESVARITDTGDVQLVALSPDGRYLAHVRGELTGDALWLRQTGAKSDARVREPLQVRYDGLAFSPDGDFIYFNTYPPKSGMASLYRMPALGGTPAKLLDDIDSAVSFSPDGKRFAFMRGYPQTGGMALMVAAIGDAGAQEPSRVAAPDAPQKLLDTDPAWSPDGRTIVVAARGADPSVPGSYMLGCNPENGALTPIGGRWFSLTGFAWMPDGRSLIVAGSDEIRGDPQVWQVPYPAGDARRITTGAARYNRITVSRDGRVIATNEYESHSNIWTVPIAGGEARQVTTAARTYYGANGVAWTADGRIVYTAPPSPNASNQIWIINADGSHVVQITNGSESGAFPAASVDGKWLYFSGGEPGRGAIWKVALDSGERQRLTRGANEFRPLPSPDGKWVYFTWSSPDGRNQPMRVSTDGGTPEVLAPIERSFNASMLDPTGKRLLGSAWNQEKRRSMGAMIEVESKVLTWDSGWPVGRLTSDWKSLLYADTKNGHNLVMIRQLEGKREPLQLMDLGTEALWNSAVSFDGKMLVVARGTGTSDAVLITARADK